MFEIIRDEDEGLIRVLNKVTDTFVKNHKQDIINGRISERLERGLSKTSVELIFVCNNNKCCRCAS